METRSVYSRCLISAALVIALTAAGVDTSKRLREMLTLPPDVGLECRDAADRVLTLELCDDRIGRGADYRLTIEQTARLAVIRVGDPPPPPRLIVGEALPAPDRSDLAGTRITSSSLRGRGTLISFFFADCAPCVEEVPILIEVARRNPALGIVAITFDPPETARRFARETGSSWPIVADARSYIDNLGIRGYPTLVLLDPKGRIAAVRSGLHDAAGRRMTVDEVEQWVRGCRSAVQPQTSSSKPTLQDFAWLAGHWRIEQTDGQTDEQWMAPAGGLMIGMARTVQGGKVREYEFTLLRQEPNGDIVYVASPSKQSETSFKLTSFNGDAAVFENPQHDFPKKIVYARQPDGSLLATIEGPGRDGKTRRVEYPFKRVTP